MAEYVLRVEIADGELASVSGVAVGPPEAAGYAQQRGVGSLRAEVLDGDGTVAWSGRWPVDPFIVAERFSESGTIDGEVEEARSRTVHVAVQGPSESTELRVRLTLAWPDETVKHLEHTFVLPHPAAASEALGAGGEVAGARAALGGCFFGCAADDPPDACEPAVGSEWDGTVGNIRGSGPKRVVFVSLGLEDPTQLAVRAGQMVTSMIAAVDWFYENADAFTFSVFRASCFEDGSFEDVDGTDALERLEALPSETDRLPPFDVLVGLVPHAIRARASDAPGAFVVVGANDPGFVLAHELGHAIGGLTDEYREDRGWAYDLKVCTLGLEGERGFHGFDHPNLTSDATPPWVCEFGGMACPGGGIVAAYSDSMCDWHRPCPNSIMRSSVGGQFDPVGVRAMDHGLQFGTVYQHGACECDASCDHVPDGACGLNGCFGLCNRCDDLCNGELACVRDCGDGPTCRDAFGTDHCGGDLYVSSVSGETLLWSLCTDP
jgi:hypothetical protein